MSNLAYLFIYVRVARVGVVDEPTTHVPKVASFNCTRKLKIVKKYDIHIMLHENIQRNEKQIVYVL